MTEMTSFAPGTFSWVELGTPNLAAATPFYQAMFGWEVAEVESEEDEVQSEADDGEETDEDEEAVTYLMGSLKGHPVAGLYQLSEDQIARGMPPHWLSYVAVSDAAVVADRAKTLGGTIIAPAMDVRDLGRMAVLQDPSGAVFALWQPRAHSGSGLVNEPGTLTWNELATRQADSVTDFYCQLFDWNSEVREMGPVLYTTFKNNDNMVGGMIQMTEEWGQIPPHWMVYFAVADCDASAAQAAELGAVVPVPPTDLPDMGRFALIQDPQGATFSVFASADGA